MAIDAVLSTEGVKTIPEILEQSHNSDDGTTRFTGMLFGFTRRDSSKDIMARVALCVEDIAHPRTRLRLTARFPWVMPVQEPTPLLSVVSGHIEDEDSDYQLYLVLSAAGASLRHQHPHDSTYWASGYGYFLKERAHRAGFELRDDILDKLFLPLEEQLKTYFCTPN